MSTEAQRKFTLVGAHRQLHANAAKELAKLEYLINESTDSDEIVDQARALALANAAADIFEIHIENHHNKPPTAAEIIAAQQPPDPPDDPKKKQEMLDKIKKLTEARGSVPLAVPRSQQNPAASVRNPKQHGKERRSSGNTANKKKELYGDT